MTLILITLAVILTTHLFGVFSPYPVSLTAAHCHSFWPEYIYGDFVHLSWYHLAVDSVAFVVIYALSPVDSILRTGRYASAYVLIFLVMNTLLNWFIMSRFYPDGPVSAYYGISATEFTMLFMVAILWLYRRPVYGGVLLGVSLLLVMMPFIMNGVSTAGLLGSFFDFVGVNHSLGRTAVWGHLCGAVLGIPAAFIMRAARSA